MLNYNKWTVKTWYIFQQVVFFGLFGILPVDTNTATSGELIQVLYPIAFYCIVLLWYCIEYAYLKSYLSQLWNEPAAFYAAIQILGRVFQTKLRNPNPSSI